LKGTYLNEYSYDRVIKTDVDAYDLHGNLLLKFRKGALNYDVLKTGYESFKDSIDISNLRGFASGSVHKRVRKDGSQTNTTVGNPVTSGNVGYMDANALVRYCRKTAFAQKYFDKFKAGIPFIQEVDRLFKELCPNHYARQIAVAKATNRNYVIDGTSFTTVTVNKNFRTAVHQDAGDYREGMGNICVYREGDWTGGLFILPEYRVAIDLQNTDMLFCDVHKFHGNSEFIGMKENDLRISFVMYYREYMYQCKQPSVELKKAKIDQTGYRRTL